MKPTPSQLWKRLISEASPMHEPVADTTFDLIVSRLRWSPSGKDTTASWESLWWSLTSRFAIPAAAAILIFTVWLPAPARPRSADQVDDLIAAALQHP